MKMEKTVFKYIDFSVLDFIQELDTMFQAQIEEKNQTLSVIMVWECQPISKIRFLIRLPVRKVL